VEIGNLNYVRDIVKRNPRRINLEELKNKTRDIISKYSGYVVEYKSFSLEDM
jgi:hypothetical protein